MRQHDFVGRNGFDLALPAMRHLVRWLRRTGRSRRVARYGTFTHARGRGLETRLRVDEELPGHHHFLAERGRRESRSCRSPPFPLRRGRQRTCHRPAARTPPCGIAVRITASEGTISASARAAGAEADVGEVAGQEARSRIVHFARRCFRVRVTTLTSGRIAPTRPRRTVPGSAGARTSTAWPARTWAAAASGTSALIHTVRGR